LDEKFFAGENKLGSVNVNSGSVESLDRVDGDLVLAEGARVKARDGRRVEVGGSIQFEGNCVFECSLAANSVRGEDGELVVEGDLSVVKTIRIQEGSLEVGGNLTAETIEVDKEVSVGKNFTALDVEVGGKLEVGGNAKAAEIEVGGDFEAGRNAEAKKLEVGGTAQIEGETTI